MVLVLAAVNNVEEGLEHINKTNNKNKLKRYHCKNVSLYRSYY